MVDNKSISNRRSSKASESKLKKQYDSMNETVEIDDIGLKEKLDDGGQQGGLLKVEKEEGVLEIDSFENR